MSIHIVTVCDDKENLKYLEKSFNIFKTGKLNCILLDKWDGFHHKVIELKNYIEPLPDDDIICFIDAYDVLMLETSETILEKFLSFQCSILFSTELTCYPYDNLCLWSNYLKQTRRNETSNFKYLNSGGYIGFKKHIYNMLAWKNEDVIIDMCKSGGDQNFFMHYFLQNYHTVNIKLDINQEIFQSMCGLNYFTDFYIVDGIVYNKVMNVTPSMLHFNGFGDMKVKKAVNIVSDKYCDIMEIFLKLLIRSKINNSICEIVYKYPFQISYQTTLTI